MTDTEVKAGLLFADTGGASFIVGAFRAGVDARFGIENAAGGVSGRKIVYSWRDDGGDPEVNGVKARELVSEEIFGMIEGINAAAGSAQYLADQKIPVTGVAAETAWAAYDNMVSWRYYTASTGSSTVWGNFIRSQGGARAVLLSGVANDAVRNYNRQLTESLQAEGISVDIIEATDLTDFVALAEWLKAERIDTVTGATPPDLLAQMLSAAQVVGVNLKSILVPFGYDPTLLNQVGSLLATTVIYLSFIPFEVQSPAHTRFLNAMTAYAPEFQPPAQESAVYGWLSADLFVRGLRAAGPCPTRQSFIQGLRAIHNYDADGLLPGPVDLATNRGMSSNCFAFVRVSDDGRRFVPLQPMARCGNPIS
ncbi:ABC transporter substrate-binding protein [Frankia nepalensis]|uniref:ABC transporter substrate-binding protein n=1 Tax=Frankia nepalensis TaxID=1836974 RepID=UPI0028899AA3|nr:ABC transporter substrate-binding protein [Frankia nepalensis]